MKKELAMKRAVLLLLSGLWWTGAFCQSDTTSPGSICIMRSTGFTGGFTGSAKKFNLFMDGSFICKLPNNSYVTFPATPGTHAIAVQMNGQQLWPNTERTDVPVGAGNTSYFSVAMSSGLVESRLELNAVMENNAKGRIKTLRQAACGQD